MSDTTTGDTRVVVTRVTSEVALPRAIVRVTGSSELHYERTLRYDRTAQHLTWDVRSAVIPDKVTAEGDMSVHPAQDGCRLAIQGRIVVNIPLIGRGIEKAVVTEILSGYNELVSVMREHLETQDLKPS